MAHRYPAFVPMHSVCTELGEVSRTHIYELVNRGDLIKINTGRRSFITGASLADYVDRLTKAAGGQMVDDEELALK